MYTRGQFQYNLVAHGQDADKRLSNNRKATMAENAENVQDLDQVGVTDVTQPTDQGEPTGEEAQTSETPEEANQKSIDEMTADELEAQLESGSVSQGDESKQEAETPEAEAQPDQADTALEKPETADPNLSGRAQDRFQKLASESKAKDEQIAALQKQLESLQRSQVAKDIGLTDPPWKRDPVTNPPQISLPQVKPGEKITPEVYQRHVNEQAQEIANRQIQAAKLQMEQAQYAQEQARQIDETMSKIRETYPELDPKSDRYDQGLDQFLGSVIGKMGQIDAKTLAAQVDSLMGYRQVAMTQGQTQAGQTLARQAAQGALVPHTASPTKPVDIENMTADEIEAYLEKHG